MAQQIQRKLSAISTFFSSLHIQNILIYFCFRRQFDYIVKDMGKWNNHKNNLYLGAKLDKLIDY